MKIGLVQRVGEGTESIIDVDPSETVGTLKKRLFKEEGARREDLSFYCKAYQIEDDDFCLGAVLKDGDQLFVNNQTNLKNKANLPSMNKTRYQCWIVSGTKENPTTQMVQLREETPKSLELKPGSFGIVHYQEGEEISEGRYQLLVYYSEEGDELQIEGSHSQIKIVRNHQVMKPAKSTINDERVEEENGLICYQQFQQNILDTIWPVFLRREYECQINVNYPDDDASKRILMKEVDQTIMEATKSTSDLDFVREVLLQIHSAEIQCFSLDLLDFKKLPWDLFHLKIEDIRKGSSILVFTLGLKCQAKTRQDLDMYRLMELVVLTIIENLQFVK